MIKDVSVMNSLRMSNVNSSEKLLWLKSFSAGGEQNYWHVKQGHHKYKTRSNPQLVSSDQKLVCMVLTMLLR